MNEPIIPSLELCDSLVEGFGPSICNRGAVLQDEMDRETISTAHFKEAETLLKNSEQRMHFRMYNILWQNTDERKSHRNEYVKNYNQTPKAKERIKSYSQQPKRKAYHLSEADELLKASEKRMHMEQYHLLWSSTEEAKVHNRKYQKEFAQLPEQKKRIKEYGQRPERKAHDKIIRQTGEYKEYHKVYVKEYRKRPYVQKREDEYLARPEVKIRMKETNRKQVKTETRKIYLHGFRRRETSKEYRRGYEREKHKTDINFHVASLLRKSLNIVTKMYGLGKIMSSKKYGINYEACAIHLGQKPDNIHVWVIDHIKPCCSFDLTDPEQVKKCFAPENLRWLTKHDNAIKASKDRLVSINKHKQKVQR